MLVTEKQKRAKMKTIGLNDLRKLNEEETLDWLKLGLDISEGLDDFKTKANDIVQMGIEEVKRNIPNISMEAVLKITKAIAKAGERDLEGFDIYCTKVLRRNELQPIESFFKTCSISQESVDEVIFFAFGDKFEEELSNVKEYWVKDKDIQKMKNDYELSDDDLLIYSSFLKSLENKVYTSKILGPFISRTPASFTRCKSFILHLLNVLRKLPYLDEGTFEVKTKHNIDEFKVSERFVFPSFAFGDKQEEKDNDERSYDSDENYNTVKPIKEEEDDEKDNDDNNNDDDDDEEEEEEEEEEDSDSEKEENKELEIILRLSGKTNKGHELKGYNNNDDKKRTIILEPETSFRVTKIEKKECSYIVYGEFIEKEGIFLENEVKEYEKKLSKTRDNDVLAAVPATGPKYAERFPDSLSKMLKLEKGYKGMSLKDAIRKANFKDSEGLIARAQGKKKELQRILKDFDLLEEDIMTINIYSLENDKKREASPYRVLNNALSNRSKETLLPLREYMFYLLIGLRNLPRFRKQNVLYRGIRMSKEELINTYREGRTLFWTTFTSTSTDENKAITFANEVRNKGDPDECGAIFEIHGKFRGYSIGSFSNFATEEEILLEPDTKFTVMMISQDEKDPNMMRVVLSVKDEEPILKEELAQFESCCEEIIIEEECRRIKDNNEQGRCSFNNQESSYIITTAQGSSEVESVKNEQQFNFSPVQNRGDVNATENEQSRSFISTIRDRGDNMSFNKKVEQNPCPSISTVQDRGTVSSFPMRGEIQKITAGNKGQPSHPTPVRGSITSINSKRELPIPMRGMIKTQEKRVMPLPFRGGVQKKQLP